jgi:hypothetical protein
MRNRPSIEEIIIDYNNIGIPYTPLAGSKGSTRLIKHPHPVLSLTNTAGPVGRGTSLSLSPPGIIQQTVAESGSVTLSAAHVSSLRTVQQKVGASERWVTCEATLLLARWLLLLTKRLLVLTGILLLLRRTLLLLGRSLLLLRRPLRSDSCSAGSKNKCPRRRENPGVAFSLNQGGTNKGRRKLSRAAVLGDQQGTSHIICCRQPHENGASK